MHWVEAAEDANPARGAAKADFMDGLQARWILQAQVRAGEGNGGCVLSISRNPGEPVADGSPLQP